MIKHTIELGGPDDEAPLATRLELLAEHIPTAWVRVIESPWRGNDNYVVDVMLLDPADEMLLAEWWVGDVEGFFAGAYDTQRQVL